MPSPLGAALPWQDQQSPHPPHAALAVSGQWRSQVQAVVALLQRGTRGKALTSCTSPLQPCLPAAGRRRGPLSTSNIPSIRRRASPAPAAIPGWCGSSAHPARWQSEVPLLGLRAKPTSSSTCVVLWWRRAVPEPHLQGWLCELCLPPQPRGAPHSGTPASGIVSCETSPLHSPRPRLSEICEGLPPASSGLRL